jgi:hypothetical protein
MTMRKLLLVSLLLLGGATVTVAQESLPAQLSACLQISGVLQRLACYDRVAHAVAPVSAPRIASRSMTSIAPAPPLAAPPVGATGLGSERLPQLASSSPRVPQQMIAGVAGVSYDGRGRFTMTLDNGQVWRQLEGDTALLKGTRFPAVRISRGVLGSYDLNIVGRNATYRVSRLQ